MANSLPAFIPFRYHVVLFDADGGSDRLRQQVCAGAFSEVSGLEASMSPKKIIEGGHNWGEHLRMGLTTFTPITLKRGMTAVDDAYQWFDLVTRRAHYGLRLTGKIEVFDDGGETALLTWHLEKVLPLKFKGADLSSTASQVAVEEIQIGHEGLTLQRRQEATR